MPSFLDEIHRIAEPDYLPTTGGVVDLIYFIVSDFDAR